jgi:hypothetical protein
MGVGQQKQQNTKTMSHLIIKPFDTVYCPEKGVFSSTWHGLQENVTGEISPDGSNVGRLFAPLFKTGFKPDFDSPISEMPAELASELGSNPITDWAIILADLRANGQGVIPVHVAKKDYTIHQNQTLWNSMVQSATAVLGVNGFTIATAGTLGAYSQFFMSLAIKGQGDFSMGKGDEWKQFFNLISSHNSLVASQIMLSSVRMVCMNTVLQSISSASDHSKIRHSKNSLELITPEAFEINLSRWVKEIDTLKGLLEMIKGKPMNLDGFRAFATGVFTNDGTDVLSTTSRNRVEEMEVLFAKGKGNSGNSYYDALNAFTEYFTSGNGVGSSDVKLAKRIASANFGRGADWKREAMRILADEDTLTATMKRGERLWEDREKIDALKN